LQFAFWFFCLSIAFATMMHASMANYDKVMHIPNN